MRRNGFFRLFWLGAAAILVVVALIALAAVAGGSFDETDGKILGALGTLLLAGGVATAGGSLLEARRAPVLGALLVGGSPILTVVCLAAIWNDFDPDGLGRAAGACYVLLAAAIVIGTARTLVGERTRLLPLFTLTTVCGVVATALSVSGIANGDVGTGWAKTLAAFWILTVLCYLLIPVGRRLVGAEATGVPRPVDLQAGAATAGAHVRLASGRATLRHEAIVVVLDGSARVGPSQVSRGQAVAAPPGTEVDVPANARALLVGR